MTEKEEIKAFKIFLDVAHKFLNTREREYKMLCKGYGKEKADAMIAAWYHLSTKDKKKP